VKILVADDNAISRHLLRHQLQEWGYEVVQAPDGDKAWDLLKEKDAPRMALLDWMMPGQTGPELCSAIRKRVGHPYVYLVLVTTREDKQDVVSGFDAGADDYLTKPYYPEELRARLRAGQRILDLEDKLVTAQDVLHYKATHDELTGLLNRAAIADLLRRELARAQRSGNPCGVLLGDLDHFKCVNDTYGHSAGDFVLCEAAARLNSGVRPYDAVGRYGGEEFLIVLPECDLGNLRTRGENLLAAFRDRPIESPDGSIPVTISLGGAVCVGQPNTTLDSLVRAADAALYRAKANGRARVELADEPVIAQVTPVQVSTR
jgi:two-component system, cell cycle response regulator